MKKLKYELLLVLLVALWGLSFSLTKPLLNIMGVFNFLTYRFLVGGLFLMMILLIKKELRFNKLVLKEGIICGLYLFIAFYFHSEGLKHTSIAKNAFIVGSTLIFIPIILYIIHKEKASKMVMLQTVVAVVGLVLITLVNATSAFNYGDFMTVIGTIMYALYTIKIEKTIKQVSAPMFTMVQLLTVGVISLIATSSVETFVYKFTFEGWMVLLFLSVVLTGVFYYLLNIIQSVLTSSNVTILFTLEPFFAVIFAWVLLNEQLTLNTVVGGSLIVLSVLLPYLLNAYRFRKVVYNE